MNEYENLNMTMQNTKCVVLLLTKNKMCTISECFLHSTCFGYVVLSGEHGSSHARNILTSNVLRGIHFAVIDDPDPRILTSLCLIHLSLLHGRLLLIRFFLSLRHHIPIPFPLL